MSSFRRHFHFGLGKPSSDSPHLPTSMHSLPEGNVMASSSGCMINRDIFLNDFSNCADMITNFVQALNSLCNAGTVLGQSFLQVFKDIPASYEVALQFQNVWEEASKATAGASADVKTETLFLLQEVLSKLDLEGDCLQECSPVVAECRQALGICLLAYTELQVYFSLFIWKSLNAVCRNLSSDEFLSMYSGSTIAGNRGINGYFGLKSHTLSSNIRKHFVHLLQKCESGSSHSHSDSPEPMRAPPGFFGEYSDRDSAVSSSLLPTPDATSPEQNVSTSANVPWSPAESSVVCNSEPVSSSSTWTLAGTHYSKGVSGLGDSASPKRTPHCVSSNSQAVVAGSKPQVPSLSRKGSMQNGMLDVPSELESVICLLSCKPSKGLEAGKGLGSTPSVSDKALLRRAVGQPWTDVQESCASLTTLGASVTSAASTSSAAGMQLIDGTKTWPRVGTTTSLPNFRSDPCFWKGGPFGAPGFGPSATSTTLHKSAAAASQDDAKSEQVSSWSTLSQETWPTKPGGGGNPSGSDDENSNSQELDYLALGVNLIIGSRQRRHSASSDWLSEISSVSQEPRELDLLWETRVGKTSTWPLKVSPRTPEPTLEDAVSPATSMLNFGINQMWNLNDPLSTATTAADAAKDGSKYSLFGRSS